MKAPDKTTKGGGKKSNVFTHTTGIVANQGLHTATVISTEHIGTTQTKYGTKNMQKFVLRVKQRNEETDKLETADIHQSYHRSFGPRAAMTQFFSGFGIQVHPGMTFDFDNLVGKKVPIVVTHSKDSNGNVHANVKAMPPVIEPEPEATYFTCTDEDCTTQVSKKGERCPRHSGGSR